jgi:hypothetical protein
MPPGHTNSIFIQDANLLLNDDAPTVFREANRQGGFTFWDHPTWSAQRSDGMARLDDLHRQFIADGLLQGIEVVNHITYSDEALQIALDNDLTIMGTSDIHGLVDWDFEVPYGGHRPLTLVFAAERSQAGIKEALLDKRTVAYFKSRLIGRSEYLLPLLEASITVQSASYLEDDTEVLTVTLANVSDADFVLANASDYTFYGHTDVVLLNAHQTLALEVKTLSRLESVALAFDVLSAVTAPNTHPRLELTANVE